MNSHHPIARPDTLRRHGRRVALPRSNAKTAIPSMIIKQHAARPTFGHSQTESIVTVTAGYRLRIHRCGSFNTLPNHIFLANNLASNFLDKDNMKKISLVIALSMFTTPAFAAPLWQGVSAGMSSKEVMEIFPKSNRSSKKIEIKKFQPTPGCDSEVTILLPNKIVTEVVVNGKDRKCAAKIYTALIGKYGDPHNENESSNQSQNQGLGGAANSYVNRQVGNLAGQQGLAGAGVGIATRLVGGIFGGGRDRSEKREAAWYSEGVMMLFEVDDENWTMTYSPMGSLGL